MDNIYHISQQQYFMPSNQLWKVYWKRTDQSSKTWGQNKPTIETIAENSWNTGLQKNIYSLLSTELEHCLQIQIASLSFIWGQVGHLQVCVVGVGWGDKLNCVLDAYATVWRGFKDILTGIEK